MDMKDLKKYNHSKGRARIPDKPGVYFFLKGKNILYIGKATSLRDRTRSYFGKDLINTRGPMILDMVFKADKIKWQETDSVLESLILEANLIKKYQPYYNTKEKDDKSFNYVCITRETLPKVLVVRGKDLLKKQENFSRLTLPRVLGGTHTTKNFPVSFANKFGPFPNGIQLREGLKIIRKIFPYLDDKSDTRGRYEFYKQISLVPDKEDRIAYIRNIKNIKLFFEGKKGKILKDLEKEMKLLAKSQKFERAGEIKRQIFALKHINDVALIKEDISQENTFSCESFRIEAYDIAHMSGKNMVGVMTVLENGKIANQEYKKFIVKTQSGANDIGALEEILLRRFRYAEWGMPDLIVMDGGIAQINVAKRVLNKYQFKIAITSVVKDEKHKAKKILGDNESLIKKYKKLILLANSEAHRFAISYYHQKSRKNMFN